MHTNVREIMLNIRDVTQFVRALSDFQLFDIKQYHNVSKNYIESGILKKVKYRIICRICVLLIMVSKKNVT